MFKYKLAIFAVAVSTFLATIAAASKKVTISPFEFSILREDGSKRWSKTLSASESLPSELELTTRDVVKFLFSADDSSDEKVQLGQAGVILTHLPSKEENFVPIPFKAVNGKYDFKLNLGSKKAPSLFQQGPGDYQLVFVAAGGALENPVYHKIGKVHFKLDEQYPGVFSDYVFEKKHPYGPKKEIHHIFRPKQKVPLAALSHLFTALVLAPWLLLLAGWSCIGVNIKGFPLTSPCQLVAALGFMGSLVAMMWVCYLYWVKFNVFEAMGYGSAVGTLLLVTGKYALADAIRGKNL